MAYYIKYPVTTSLSFNKYKFWVPVGIAASQIQFDIKDIKDHIEKKLVKTLVSLTIHPGQQRQPDIGEVLTENTDIEGKQTSQQ